MWRFGHLIHEPTTTALGWDLTPLERKQVEAEIHALRHASTIPLTLSAGHYSTDPLPCAPLHLQEVNVDCHGNLTKCCSLSGHGSDIGNDDIIGNLQDVPFAHAVELLHQENERHQQARLAYLASTQAQDTDFFPCWYCTNYYRKVGWLKQNENHSMA